jgi:phosphoribosylformimino-5-aminoimidazole carboxamide ribotide isomerase
VVVRGVAGERARYRPIKSSLTPHCDALSVASAFRESFGLMALYVADLDAILRRQPNIAVLRALCDAGFRLLVDGGVERAEHARELFAAGAQSVIAGFETLAGPEELRRCCEEFGADRIVFSLDLREGEPMGGASTWGAADPFELAMAALRCGVRRLIVLDVAQVGTSRGPSAVPLCRRIREAAPEIELITGGGIRHRDDLQLLATIPVDGVLIASALHDGRITREDLASLESPL